MEPIDLSAWCSETFGAALFELRTGRSEKPCSRKMSQDALGTWLDHANGNVVSQWEKGRYPEDHKSYVPPEKRKLPEDLDEVLKVVDALGCKGFARKRLIRAYGCDVLVKKGITAEF